MVLMILILKSHFDVLTYLCIVMCSYYIMIEHVSLVITLESKHNSNVLNK